MVHVDHYGLWTVMVQLDHCGPWTRVVHLDCLFCGLDANPEDSGFPDKV